MATIKLELSLFLVLGFAVDQLNCNIVPSRKICLQLCRMKHCSASSPDSDIRQIQTGSLRFRIRQERKGHCIEDCLQSGKCFLTNTKDSNSSDDPCEHFTRLLLHPYRWTEFASLIYSPSRNTTTVIGTAFNSTIAIGFIPSLNKILYSIDATPSAVYSVDYISGVLEVWMKGCVEAMSVDIKRKRVFYLIFELQRMCVYSVTFDGKWKTRFYKTHHREQFNHIFSGEEELYFCVRKGLMAVTHKGKKTRLIESDYVVFFALDQSQNVLYYSTVGQLVRLELKTRRMTTYRAPGYIYDMLVIQGVLYMSLPGKLATFEDGTLKDLKSVVLDIHTAFLLCDMSTN